MQKLVHWNSITLVRLLLPFCVGIISAVFVFPASWWFPVFFLSGVILLLLLNRPRLHARYYNHVWTYGVLINLVFILAGVSLTHRLTAINAPSHIVHKPMHNSGFVGVLYEPVKKKPKSYRTSVRVKYLIDGSGKKHSVTGNVLLYMQHDSVAAGLLPGDMIAFYAAPQKIRPPSNPSEFNYKRYLSFHNVYHQSYVKSGSWQYLGSDMGNAIQSYAHDARVRLLNVFRSYNIQGREFAVLSALMLGYKDELDTDIMRAYSSAGAMHVLAVSGLHVGMIYIALGYMLFFLDGSARSKQFKIVILIAFLWFYAAMTGLSPSVLRACTMFSFIAVGGVFMKKVNVFNMLAASAFLLLIIDPFLIMAVGFQLSYLAVIGIVTIHPRIYKLIRFKNFLLDKIWTIIVVSIAAQIATFPLAMLYFHQFPNYFIFSNLIVIPLATAIIYMGLITLLFGFYVPLQAFVAKVLAWFVMALNESVFFIERFPYSITENISISILEAWFMYVSIVLFIMFSEWRIVKHLRMAMLGVACLSLVYLWENFNHSNQKLMAVYDIKGKRAVSFVKGRDQLLVADTSLTRNAEMVLFHMRHFWDDIGIANTHSFDAKIKPAQRPAQRVVHNNYPFFGFEGKTILLLDDGFVVANEGKLDVDYLIVSGNNIRKRDQLLKQIIPQLVIIDSSVKRYAAGYWKKQCEVNAIPMYDVNSSGCYLAHF